MDLIGAIISKNMTQVSYLLEGNVNLQVSEDESGVTPLHHAVMSSTIEIIFLLLHHEADPFFYSDAHEESAFELACSLGRYDAVSLFINAETSLLIH